MTLAETVASIVQKRISTEAETVEVRPDQSLLELGLSSVRLIELIMDIEDHFEVSLCDEDIIPSNFHTITTITNLLAAYLSSKNR